MYDFFAQKKAKLPLLRLPLNTVSVPAFFMLLLLIGILFGTLIGVYAERMVFPDKVSIGAADVSESLILSVWNSGKYLLLLLFSATSYLGLVTIPATILLRGYALSCAVSAMFVSSSYRGLLSAFLLCGFPAILTIPPMMVLSLDCFARSAHLLRIRFGKYIYPLLDTAYLRHFLATLLLTLASVFYTSYILPHLLMLL